MTYFARIAFLALAFALAGCGGGGSTPAAPAAGQNSPPQPVAAPSLFTGHSATIFVGTEYGLVKAFDETGHLNSAPGAYPGLFFVGPMAYDRFLQRLYVIDFGKNED